MAETDLITLPRATVHQALEVLEALQGGCTDHNDGTVEAITVWCPEVIDALRAALEQPYPDPAHEYRKGFIDGQIEMRDRPEEQPEQEPDRWGEGYEAGYAAGMAEMKQEQAKPVAIVEIVVPHLESIGIKHILGAHFPQVGDYLYTAPPRREWVGLTEEDKEGFFTADQMTQEEWDELYQAAEAKLKEKNHD